MIKILHLADLHLGRSHGYLGERAAARMREADTVLQRAADYVVHERPDVEGVVIAGDVFESYRPADSLVGGVIGVLRGLVEAGKTVITLPGNHDELSYADCVYWKHRERWPGALVTSPGWAKVATVETADGPCHFYGIAYQAGLTPDALDPSIPLETDGLHVAVLHASVGLPGKDRAIQSTWEDLGKLRTDYVALGHVHKPDQRSLLKGVAVYPGLVEGSGFDDPGCGELVVASLSGGSVEVERIPFGARRIHTEAIDLGDFDDPGGVTERIRALSDPDLILRVRLGGTAGFDASASVLAGELAGGFHHLEVEDDSTPMGAADVEAAAGEETVLGRVIRDLREREAKAGTDAERAAARRAIRHVWEAFRGGGACG